MPGERGCDDADAGVASTRAARPGLRREGAWPETAERVTLNVEGLSRAEAIRRLADAAGWSVIVRGVGNDAVDVRVTNQPAARVLELILAGEPYVAQRDGRHDRDRTAGRHRADRRTGTAASAASPSASASPVVRMATTAWSPPAS